MIGTTHVGLTRFLLERVLEMPFSEAEWTARWATFPDDVEDIGVGRFGTKIAGRKIGSLTHFVAYVGREELEASLGRLLFRGYSWRMDRSIGCIRRLDPRIGNVLCHPEPWLHIVGKPERVYDHPLRKLTSLPINLDADDFTFPTAAVMAEWLWRPWTSDVKKPPVHGPTLGSVAHFVQDACVPHHANGWLLRGHQKYEQQMQKEWESCDPEELLREAIDDNLEGWGPRTPRGLVESAAMAARAEPVRSPKRSLAYALSYTRAFLLNCVR